MPVVALSLVTGFICWFFGIGVLPAIVVVLTIGSIGVVVRAASQPTTPEWPSAPLPSSAGDRRESSELSWAMRVRGRGVDQRILRRISRIAANRLAQRQLDLDNPLDRPAIERLLGRATFAIVCNPESARVRLPDLVALLDHLDALQRPGRPQPVAANDPNSEK